MQRAQPVQVQSPGPAKLGPTPSPAGDDDTLDVSSTDDELLDWVIVQQNSGLELAQELFERHRAVRKRLSREGDAALVDVAGELGRIVLALSRDERLALFAEEASTVEHDVREELVRLANVDWSVFLVPVGYRGPPPVGEYASQLSARLFDAAEFGITADGDSVSSLRGYLADLGTRLVHDGQQSDLSKRARTRRLRRRIGRALWTVGRVAAAGLVVGFLTATVGTPEPALAAAAAAAVPVVGQALIEEAIPPAPKGDHTERADLMLKAARLADFLDERRAGVLADGWKSLSQSSRPWAAHLLPHAVRHASMTVDLCSEIAGRAIVLFDLGLPIWGAGGSRLLERLFRDVETVRGYLVQDPPDTSAIVHGLEALEVTMRRVGLMVEQQVLEV